MNCMSNPIEATSTAFAYLRNLKGQYSLLNGKDRVNETALLSDAPYWLLVHRRLVCQVVATLKLES